MAIFSDDPKRIVAYAIYSDGSIEPVDKGEVGPMMMVDANEMLAKIIDAWVDYCDYARRNPQPRTSSQQAVLTRKWHTFFNTCNRRFWSRGPMMASPFKFDPDVVNSVLSYHFGFIVSEGSPDATPGA